VGGGAAWRNNVLAESGFTNLRQREDFDFLFDIEAEKAV
jgi:hypothetical protein